MKSIKKTPNPDQPESLKKVSAIGFQVSAKTKRAVKSRASRE